LQALSALIRSDVFAPVSRMSLEAVGVDMTIQGARLPHFWNFSLRWVNPIGIPALHPPGSEVPHALIREFLGHAWFYVLLVNGTQPMAQLNAAIEEQLVKAGNLDMHTKELFNHDAFDPGNIFWHPRAIELAPDWHTLWIEAIEQGMRLLRAGSNGVSEFTPGAVEARLEELKSRVHQCLFNAPAVVQESAGKTSDNTRARIAAILSDILDRWPSTAAFSDKEPLRTDQESSSELPKTAVLTSDQPPAATEELAKTVVISPSGGRPAGPDTSSIANTAGADEPTEPVVDELEETVVLYPGKGETGKAGS
jgi:hypothetical protein